VRRGVDILCIQETKWKGQKAKEVEDTSLKGHMGALAMALGIKKGKMS
jgi:hypothetical protein